MDKRKIQELMALQMIAAATMYESAGRSPSGWNPTQYEAGIKTNKSIYRFYADGTWSFKRKKGVQFECVADSEGEAKEKYETYLSNQK